MENLLNQPRQVRKLKSKPKQTLFEEASRQEIIDSLPVVVSKIEVQKQDPTRVSIFCNDTFFVGLPIYVAENIGLKKGLVIDRSKLSEIESTVIRDGIRSWILRLLGSRTYSRKQLQTKCKQVSYNEDVVSSILDELSEKGWLDDSMYARAFARDKMNFQRWGPAKIRQQLSLNGVSSSVIQEVLNEEVSDVTQIEAMFSLVKKRTVHFLRESDTLKRKKKVIDFLLRKGYNHGIVFSNIDKLLNEINS